MKSPPKLTAVKSTGEQQKTASGKCSICGRPMVHEFRPFCSRRCSDVDLSRWLTGSYAIADGGADADEDGESNTDLPETPAPERQTD